ncbi:MAG: hypothetical protein KME13_20860 [Myxacorys californica WJT36-NPBG1]|jgi:hypothetical protein|nr:hypothetical protein [Myxacorys californica WJT36-NPBG1]
MAKKPQTFTLQRFGVKSDCDIPSAVTLISSLYTFICPISKDVAGAEMYTQ